MIHGIYHFGKKRTACRNDYCTVCQAPTFAEGRRSLVMLHLIFVPLIPLGLHTRWFCTRCGNQTEAKRPSRKGIMVAGIVFGCFLTLGSTILLIVERNPRNLLGMGMGAGLILVLVSGIKRQNYDAYLAAKRSVVPLRGDTCPFCHEAVLPAIEPRCHACDVKIVTKPLMRA